MNRRDIIEKVKPAAIEVMQDRRVLASLLIAESVLISEKYTEIKGNNPLRLKDYDTDALKTFDTIEDCFNFFISVGIVSNGRSNIIGNYNYKSLVKNLRLGETSENSLIEIIESYRLYEIDNDIISSMYDGRRTVVEIDTEPFIDQYRVREAYGKIELLCTSNKQEAIDLCKKYYGYSVFNSRGKAIYTNALTPEIKAKLELEEELASKPRYGNKVYLTATNLYATPDSKVPTRSITGFFYICDNKRYNNRYMITDKLENIDNKERILGYINDKDRR